LTPFPELVVVYLGFRVSGWQSFWALMGIGRKLNRIAQDKPDGLLLHEPIFYGFGHVGMRQYWRDFDSLERFTRSEPHKSWWRDFSKDTKGGAFWHEAYRKSGGIEGLYAGFPSPIGLGRFAPAREPVGPYARSRGRLAA
jgi:hypothetical protein